MAQKMTAIVTKHPATFWNNRKRCLANYLGLKGSDGDWYYDDHGEIRLWRTEGGAVRWFARAVDSLHDIEGIIVKLDGSSPVFGQAGDDALPHAWSKQNLVTILESGGGSYDMWRCDHCGKRVKRYGLSGRPQPGRCPVRSEEKR